MRVDRSPRLHRSTAIAHAVFVHEYVSTADEVAAKADVGIRGGPSSLTPEVLELRRRQFGIAHGVLDRLVPEVILNAPRIMPRIGQGVAAGVP